MLPPNTVEILKSLNKNELKKLADFISSPYFNSKESLHHLTNEITKHYPEFKPEKFEYKRVYKKIYRADEYKEQTIRNLYSEFGVLLRKFVAYERLESHETDFNRMLINGLRDKKCYELSNKAISRMKKEPLKSFNTEEDYYYEMYYLENLYAYNITSLNKLDLNEYHEVFNNIIDNLSSFYLSNLFYYSGEDSVLTKVHRVKKLIPGKKAAFLNSFNEKEFFKPEYDSPDTAFLKIRYLCFVYSNKDITFEEYKELEELVMKNIESFSVHFINTCWFALLVLILIKLVPKDKKHYQDAFLLNDYFTKLDIFPNDKNVSVSISLFKDVFGTALVLKEYEWAQNFIDKFSPYLEDEARDNEVNYSLGRLNFQLKKYENSIDYLNKVIYPAVLEKINVRFYYLMNYIELKSYQSAISMLNSIKQFYLESKEIPEMFAVLIESSIKFFREIIKAEENNKKVDFAILKEAENAGRYYQKQYIIGKLKTLV